MEGNVLEIVKTLPEIGIFVIAFIWVWAEKILPRLKNGNGKYTSGFYTGQMSTDLKIISKQLIDHEGREEKVLQEIANSQKEMVTILAQQTEILRRNTDRLDRIEREN